MNMKTDDKSNLPKVRIAIIGMSNVGKSALTVRYLTRRYIGEYRSNTDLLYKQTLSINNSLVDVEIVDVCCKSDNINDFPEEPIYWADACVVVYDVTSKSSLTYAAELLQTVNRLRGQNPIPTALIGNKADLEHLREIDGVTARTIAIQNNCFQSLEVSVAENTLSIYSFFNILINECRSALTNNGQKTRKFSVSKMITTLIGNSNGKTNTNSYSNGGTVVVCHKSDLYKSRLVKRRQNNSQTASL